LSQFCVLDVESPGNVILERSWINMMKVVMSTYHQLLKYPTSSGMASIRGDQAIARKDGNCSSPEEVQLGAKGLPSRS